jgi:molybdate-binding protein/DNA-binding XRE family transcriptional regulator
VKARVENRLAEIRTLRGVGASELARRVGVSRQTIYAIEAGTYVPNTEVALNLARELEVPFEGLFSLQDESGESNEPLKVEMLSGQPSAPGQAVRICQLGNNWVGVPVSASPCFMPEADGVVRQTGLARGRTELTVFAKDEAAQKRLVLAGCDPATGLLSHMVEKVSGVEVVSAPASSKLALTWLCKGKVHIAGSHLEDAATGEFNLPFLRRNFPGEDLTVITFAHWEEGLVLAPGNPKSIHSIADLARPDVRFSNREPGSGSRALLDQLLAKAGIPDVAVHGYQRIAFGHLAAAYTILTGDADVCLATQSAANSFGLDFIPLHRERYDLVMRRRTADMPVVKVFLDVLQRATLRRKLEVLAGYDTSETGDVVV